MVSSLSCQLGYKRGLLHLLILLSLCPIIGKIIVFLRWNSKLSTKKENCLLLTNNSITFRHNFTTNIDFVIDGCVIQSTKNYQNIIVLINKVIIKIIPFSFNEIFVFDNYIAYTRYYNPYFNLSFNRMSTKDCGNMKKWGHTLNRLMMCLKKKSRRFRKLLISSYYLLNRKRSTSVSIHMIAFWMVGDLKKVST